MTEIPSAAPLELPDLTPPDEGPRLPLLTVLEARRVVWLLREFGGMEHAEAWLARDAAATLAMRLPADE